MDEVLFRTALSPGIREQHDEFPLIADPSGKMVVGQFGLSIPDFLDGFEGDIGEGDVLLTSDPYACGAAISHANDWLVVAADLRRRPGGRLGVDVRAHVRRRRQDAELDAHRRAHDLRGGRGHPALQLYSAGTLNEDALRIILNQVRVPDWNRADLGGLVAACRTAARRVQEMCARFGTDTYLSALDALLQRNYDAMKTLLSVVFEEGRTLAFTDYICDDGVGFGPYELKMALTRTGDKVHLDLTGSSPQAAGPVNYYINENLIRMFFGIYMITVADPQILWNDGFYPLVDVTIPDGSYWKPKYPAALNARNHGIGRVFDLFGGLLGQTNPALLNAAGFSSSPHFMYSGTYGDGERKGEWFQLYSIGFGGIPGRPMGDGPDGHSLWPSFVNIPCEFLESYYPLRIEKWETVADTGGAGLHRGGNGVDVAYHFLEAGTIAIHDDRWLTYPWGVNGGTPGARGTKWLDRADGTHEVLPSKCHDVAVAPGRRAALRHLGRRRLGRPARARPASSSRSRSGAGWSPRDGARRYGVVLTDGAVDQAATDAAADGDARRPARGAAGLRHGAAAGADPRARAGGDRPARADPARRARERRRHDEGFGSRLAWGSAPGPARDRHDAGLLHRGLAAVPARPGRGRRLRPAARRRPGQRRPRGAHPVAYAPGLADAGLFVRKVPALAPAGRGRARSDGSSRTSRRSAGETVVVKQYASAFFGTSLASTLRAADRDTVVVCGVSTSGCVRASATDALQHGFVPARRRRRLRRPHPGRARREPVRPRRQVRRRHHTAEAVTRFGQA